MVAKGRGTGDRSLPRRFSGLTPRLSRLAHAAPGPEARRLQTKLGRWLHFVIIARALTSRPSRPWTQRHPHLSAARRIDNRGDRLDDNIWAIRLNEVANIGDEAPDTDGGQGRKLLVTLRVISKCGLCLSAEECLSLQRESRREFNLPRSRS